MVTRTNVTLLTWKNRCKYANIKLASLGNKHVNFIERNRMSVAYETTPSDKQVNIPTQNLESPFEERRLARILEAVIPQQHAGDERDLGKPLDLQKNIHLPLDDEGLEILRGRLDRRENVSSVTILTTLYEQLGIMPPEIDDAGQTERKNLLEKIREIEVFYRNNFFIFDSKSTSNPRIDMGLIEDLYESTDLAKTPVLQSITNAQNHNRLGSKYRIQLMEADRIARIMFLDNQA